MAVGRAARWRPGRYSSRLSLAWPALALPTVDLFVAEATTITACIPWSKSPHVTTIRLYTCDETDAVPRPPCSSRSPRGARGKRVLSRAPRGARLGARSPRLDRDRELVGLSGSGAHYRGGGEDQLPQRARLGRVIQRAVVCVGEQPFGECHPFGPDGLGALQALDHRGDRELRVEDLAASDDHHSRPRHRGLVGLGYRPAQGACQSPTAPLARQLRCAQRKLGSAARIGAFRQRTGKVAAVDANACAHKQRVRATGARVAWTGVVGWCVVGQAILGGCDRGHVTLLKQ